MLANLSTLGIRFDIGKIDAATYGYEAWKIFWRVVDIENLPGCLLFEGDTMATLNGSENVFCIAVQSMYYPALQQIRAALEKDAAFNSVLASPPFVEDAEVVREPLVDSGRVDAFGRLVGGAWAQSALETVRKRANSPAH